MQIKSLLVKFNLEFQEVIIVGIPTLYFGLYLNIYYINYINKV